MSTGAKLVLALLAAALVTGAIVIVAFALADLSERVARPCPPGTATTYDVAGYRSGCVGPVER